MEEIKEFITKNKWIIIRFSLYIISGVGIFVETGVFTLMFFYICCINFELNKEL